MAIFQKLIRIFKFFKMQLIVNKFSFHLKDRVNFQKKKAQNLCPIKCINWNFIIYLFYKGDDQATLNVWNINKKKPILTVKDAHDDRNNQKSWISAVGTLKNTDLFASGSSDGKIRVWKITEKFRNVEPLFEIDAPGVVNDIRIHGNGYLVAAIGREHRMGRWFSVKGRDRVLVAKLF